MEILSACPVNWGLTPSAALDYVKTEMVPYYPLGDYKVTDAVKGLK